MPPKASSSKAPLKVVASPKAPLDAAKKSDDYVPSSRPSAWGPFSDFAGAQDGKFFDIVPKHVDREKRPGESTLPKPTLRGWLLSALSLAHVWASPNTVWSAIALAMYFLVPFDLSKTGAAAKGPVTAEFFVERFPLWFFVTFGYTAFFHVSLYSGFVAWAKRGFIKDRTYRWSKTLHNCFWSLSGVAIWVAFENVFCFLWATDRLKYMSDAEAFSTSAGMLRFFAGLALIPLWRDSHFYFAHRLLHVQGIYKQVHALHHRNTDIEPFAGLSMHPVEHLYYYACILPNLLCFASPFHMLWNGAHLLLAPGASHSGFEDHFQADAFHYMHRAFLLLSRRTPQIGGDTLSTPPPPPHRTDRYFECNYAGLNAAMLDVAFGTFKEKFDEYNSKGNEYEKDKKKQVSERADAKSNLLVLKNWSVDFVAYLIVGLACMGAWLWWPNSGKLSSEEAIVPALLAGFGPVAFAFIFDFLSSADYTGSGTSILKHGYLAAFLNLGIGTLFCSVPITLGVYWAVMAPQ